MRDLVFSLTLDPEHKNKTNGERIVKLEKKKTYLWRTQKFQQKPIVCTDKNSNMTAP